MILGDRGAEVLKIEEPELGDDTRGWAPFVDGWASYFVGVNRNKKSVALDLKTADGCVAFERLVATADAVMNNLRGDQPEKLGLDYASLRHLNPRIVCLHISAYGRDNERKSWPGYDFLMQAEAGIMGLTGDPDGPPTRVGASMVDFMTGATGATGLLACILRAQRSGTGCDVDTCLFDVALHQLSYAAVWYLNERDAARRMPRSAHLAVAPVQTFPTADGWIFIMCMTDKFWTNLTDTLGRADLANDARFATQAARRQNRAALSEMLDCELRKRPTGEWLQLFAGLLPAAPVYEMDEALDAEFPQRTGMVRNVPTADRPDFRVLGNPIKVNGQRAEQAAAPTLGADNAVLLARETA